MRGSPADKAGIKPGDVLTQVAGKPVKDAQAMLELIAALEPGKTARFDLKREGATSPRCHHRQAPAPAEGIGVRAFAPGAPASAARR
jgi:PDZ domain-containing secreted protein